MRTLSPTYLRYCGPWTDSGGPCDWNPERRRTDPRSTWKETLPKSPDRKHQAESGLFSLPPDGGRVQFEGELEREEGEKIINYGVWFCIRQEGLLASYEMLLFGISPDSRPSPPWHLLLAFPAKEERKKLLRQSYCTFDLLQIKGKVKFFHMIVSCSYIEEANARKRHNAISHMKYGCIVHVCRCGEESSSHPPQDNNSDNLSGQIAPFAGT